MINIFKYTLVFLILSFSSLSVTSEFNEALDTIEIRKTAMQSLWERIKRLSPYVELKEKVEYDKNLAVTDAEEVVELLQYTKNLWHNNSW